MSTEMGQDAQARVTWIPALPDPAAAEADHAKADRNAEVRATFASMLDAIGLTDAQRGALAEWMREARQPEGHPDVNWCWCGDPGGDLADLIGGKP